MVCISLILLHYEQRVLDCDLIVGGCAVSSLPPLSITKYMKSDRTKNHFVSRSFHESGHRATLFTRKRHHNRRETFSTNIILTTYPRILNFNFEIISRLLSKKQKLLIRKHRFNIHIKKKVSWEKFEFSIFDEFSRILICWRFFGWRFFSSSSFLLEEVSSRRLLQTRPLLSAYH